MKAIVSLNAAIVLSLGFLFGTTGCGGDECDPTPSHFEVEEDLDETTINAMVEAYEVDAWSDLSCPDLCTYLAPDGEPLTISNCDSSIALAGDGVLSGTIACDGEVTPLCD